MGMFKQLPEAGRPGVLEFFKSALESTILFRFSEDKQTLVAWNSLSETTSDQLFSIVSIDSGIEIIWTGDGLTRSRFVEKTQQCTTTACFAQRMMKNTLKRTPAKRKCAIQYFKRVLLPKKIKRARQMSI